MGSCSLTRDWICIPHIGRRILSHWTTRGSPQIWGYWFETLCPFKYRPFSAINFPRSTALVSPHEFGLLCFHFHSVQNNPYSSFQFLFHWFMDYLEMCYLVSKHFGDFPMLFLLLISNLISLWSENYFVWFAFSFTKIYFMV